MSIYWSQGYISFQNSLNVLTGTYCSPYRSVIHTVLFQSFHVHENGLNLDKVAGWCKWRNWCLWDDQGSFWPVELGFVRWMAVKILVYFGRYALSMCWFTGFSLILFLKRYPRYESPLKIHTYVRILAISTVSWNDLSSKTRAKFRLIRVFILNNFSN